MPVGERAKREKRQTTLVREKDEGVAASNEFVACDSLHVGEQLFLDYARWIHPSTANRAFLGSTSGQERGILAVAIESCDLFALWKTRE